jgi:hypothetical protein
MADVTEAIEQDQVAESLLGDSPTETTTDNATAGTEAEVQPLEESQAEPEQETQPEESAEDWLPTEQDRTFSDEALLRYAERYQKDAQWLSDPLNRQLLTDKLNSDIYLRQQQEQEPLEELESELPQQQLQEVKPPTLDEHMANLGKWSEQYTDPKVAQMFADSFMKAFGVNEPAKPETAIALARTMSTFGVNLVQTVLPQVLPMMLDNVMPGFSGMYYQASRASSWDQVRNSTPQFAELPDYGSKAFVEICEQLANEYPALTEMGTALERANGGQLHGPAADKFYGTLAKLATKQQIDPQLLQQAAQAGARSARRGEVRRSAGNLGAGQSKGAVRNPSGSSKFQTNSDLFDDEAMSIYQREHGKM